MLVNIITTKEAAQNITSSMFHYQGSWEDGLVVENEIASWMLKREEYCLIGQNCVIELPDNIFQEKAYLLARKLGLDVYSYKGRAVIASQDSETFLPQDYQIEIDLYDNVYVHAYIGERWEELIHVITDEELNPLMFIGTLLGNREHGYWMTNHSYMLRVNDGYEVGDYCTLTDHVSIYRPKMMDVVRRLGLTVCEDKYDSCIECIGWASLWKIQYIDDNEQGRVRISRCENPHSDIRAWKKILMLNAFTMTPIIR